MNSEKLIEIKAAVYEMGLLFNQMPNDEKISAYAKALYNYEPRQIVYAFNQVIKSGSAFFPSLAEILKHLTPINTNSIDRAPQIAQEMIQMVRWYGKHDEATMLEKSSPEARVVFEKWGNTDSIRLAENTETIRAQLERLARSVLQSSAIEEKNEQLKQLGIVIPIKRLDKKETQSITQGPA